MPLEHSMAERYEAAMRFIRNWSAHRPDCQITEGGWSCACGYGKALRELNHFCTVTEREAEGERRAAEQRARLGVPADGIHVA